MENNCLLVRKQNVFTADMNGETVMMDTEKGKYFNLGAVGGRIWEVLEKKMTLEELVEILTGEYNIDYDTCLNDVKEFVEKLVSMGLVEIEA